MTFLSFRKNALSAAALLAVAGATMGTAAQAQSVDFSWYGRIDMGLENGDNGAVSRTFVNNFASRLGLRGERKFGADLTGMFQVETGIAPDDTANSKAFANRNSFVGVKSVRLGTALIGTHDMPLKALEGTSGGLWGQGDLLEILVHGKGTAATVGSSFGNVHTRKTNVLHYASPKFMNVVAKVAYSPDEAKVAAAGAVPEYAKSMFGASVEYNDGTFNGGLAWQSQENFAAPTATVGGKAMKAAKATVGAKMNAWSAGLAYSVLGNENGRKTSNYVVSGSYALDAAITLKASFGKSGESAANAQDDVTGTAFEADYSLDKQTTVYAYLTQLSNGAKGKGTLVSSDNFPAVVTAGETARALGVGIRYNF